MHQTTNQMKRREFLNSATTAAALTATAGLSFPRIHAEAARKPERKPILKSLKFGMVREKLSIMDKFKLLKDLGYDGVELNSPGGANKKQCLEASQKTELPIHGVVDSRHWRVRATDPKPEQRKKCAADLLTAVKDSHFCGGTSVLFVPGHGKDGPEEKIVPLSMEVIKEVLPTAEELKIHILIENVWNHMFYDHEGKPEQSADRLAAFIDGFKTPLVGSYFDIGNHHKYGQPEGWVRTLGKRIVKLDVKDFSRKRNNWAKLGEGTIDYSAVRNALDEIGFSGWCTAEVGGGNRKRLALILEKMNQLLPNA